MTILRDITFLVALVAGNIIKVGFLRERFRFFEGFSIGFSKWFPTESFFLSLGELLTFLIRFDRRFSTTFSVTSFGFRKRIVKLLTKTT